MPFCSACGEELKKADKFCPSCGASRKADATVKTKEIEEKARKEDTEEAVYRGMERLEKEKDYKKNMGCVVGASLILSGIIGVSSGSMAGFWITLLVSGVIFSLLLRLIMGLPMSEKK